MSLRETDLLAVGGGTAGLVSAAGAAYLGASPTLVEKSALGGDCLWTGCVPSKALLASARLAHQMRHAEALGLRGTAPGPAFGEVMARMRSARDTVAHHDDPERFRSMGVEVAFGSARFVDRDVVEVEGVGRIRSKRIILATGAVPAPPPVPGLEEVGYLDHHSVFEIDSLPARVTILGGGPIGLEFSQIFRRLGAEVTVVEMSDRLLPKEDRDMAEVLGRILRGEGIDIRLGSRAEKAERRGEAVVVRTDDGRELLVGLGQSSYREAQGFALEVGDRVTVEGFYEDGEFKAGTLQNLATGEALVLRDTTGRPMWAGAGRGQNRN